MSKINRLHFLLVEDDDDHAELILRNLRQHEVGCTFDRVCDGVEALAYLRRQGSYESRPRPNVVLLDLNMPRKNGHEVLREMKVDDDLRRIPVVVLTTSNAETDRRQAYNLYANSYLVKPVEFAHFQELARELSHYWGQWNKPSI